MTISFSGLASGLDTSAWIQALTSLRQAKVNTIATQREKVSVSQNALATIKNYFSTFRTSLEKLTDAKFGISTMDLFTQNTAKSSNNTVFTAVAGADAKEDSYSVKVKQLATNTKAKSTYYTQITNKTTAVGESTLEDIGIESGKVMFKVNGIDRGIVVDSSDTISEFVNKLNDIGVAASYNEASGAFNMNVSVSDITDKGNTGLIDKLHLVGVNEGYRSANKLQVIETRETIEMATLDTRIADLDTGIQINQGDYVEIKNSSGEIFNISINDYTTIGDFVTALNDSGLYAKFNEKTSVMEISGGAITGGTFDANSVFGLTQQASSAMATGERLSETIVIPDAVTLQTRLVDDIGTQKGYMEITKPGGTKYYERIYSGQTIGDLMTDLGNLGITSSLDSQKGILTITGGDFRALTDEEVNDLINQGKIIEDDDSFKKATNLLNILGFSDATTTIKYSEVQSQALTYRKTDVAFKNDKISDYITMPENKEIVVHEKTGEILGTVTVSETSTFDNLFGELAEFGIDGQIHNGQIMIDSSRELYVTGDVMEALGMDTNYVTTITTTTVGKTQTTGEVTYEITDYAKNESVINDFVQINSNNNELVIKDKDGDPIVTVTVTATTTFGDLFNNLAPHGVSGQLYDGTLNLIHNQGGYIDGSFAAAIGMSTTYKTVVTTTTAGGTQTTGAKIYNTEDVADYDSKISNFISINSSNNSLVVKDIDGEAQGTVTVTDTMTFRELFAALTPYGVDGDIEDGQVTFFDNDGGYVDGSFATALGIGMNYRTVTTTTTVGGVQTTAEKTFQSREVAIADSVINQFNVINSSSNQIIIKNESGDPTKTVTVTDTMTFRDLFSELSKYGVYGNISNGVLSLYENNGGYVDGSFCRSMGMTTNYTTVYSTTTVGQTSTGSARNYTVASDATGSTTFAQIGSGGNKTWTIINGQTGAIVAYSSFGDGTTIGQFADILGQYGFEAGIDGGYFTASSAQGYYVKGTAADALGLGTYTYTMSGHGTCVRTVAATDTQVVNQTRTLSVSSSGNVTINAQQTVVFDQTRTLSVASSGYVTVTARQIVTVNVAQTLAVTTTQAKTITTTIVTTATFNASASSTVSVTYNVAKTSTVAANGSAKLSDVGLLSAGSGTIKLVRTDAVASKYGVDSNRTTIKQVVVNSSDTIDQLVSKINSTMGSNSVTASFTNGVLSINYTGTDGNLYGVNYYESYEPYGYTYTWYSKYIIEHDYYMSYVTGGYCWHYTSGTQSYYYPGGYDAYGSACYSADFGLEGLGLFGAQNKSIQFTSYQEYGAYYSGYTTVSGYVNSCSKSLGMVSYTLTQTVASVATSVSVNRTVTSTSTSVQTVTVQTVGTTTVNVSRTMTVDVSRTVAVATSGKTTVRITQTMVVNATQTTNVATTGYTTVNISQSVTLTAHQTVTVDITDTRTVTANKSSGDHNTYKTTYNMDGNTQLSQVGLGDGTITVVHAGTIGIVTIKGSSTVDSIINQLSAYGVEASISAAGAMTFKGTNDGYIIGATGSAATLGATGTYTSSTTSVVYGVTSAASPKEKIKTKKMDGETTFTSLGLNGGSATVNYKGQNYTVNMSEQNTMYDFMTALGGLGVSAMISDGKMTVQGTSEGYIVSTSGGISDLGITTSTVLSTSTVVNATNTASTREYRTITQTMTSDTTLAQLGWNAGTVSGYYQGNSFNITMQTQNTIGDLVSALGARGITGTISNDGNLTLTGSVDGYITGVTGGLASGGLGIGQSTVLSTSTVVNGITSATNPERPLTLTMTSSTTFGDMGLEGGIAKVNHLGKEYNISMTQNSTMQDLMTALQSFGISAYIKDGNMTVAGTNSGYIVSTTGGVKALGINTSMSKTITTVTTGDNTLSTTLSRTTNPTLDRSTRVIDLYDSNGNNLGITEGNYYIYENGVRYTKSITAETTVNDLFAEFAEYNLIADISEDGTIVISGDGASYLETSSIGGQQNSNFVEKIFSHWDFTKVYNSSDLTIPTPVLNSITKNTKLKDIASDIDFHEGLITVLKNGVQVNLFVNGDDTVGTFIDELAMHGFETIVNDKGQLIVKTNGNSRLQNYSSELQASNILDILGINSDNWIQTNNYQSKKENVIKYNDEYVNANEHTLLSSIDKGGNMLETFNGTIELNVDGMKNTISVNENETVGSLLNKFRGLGLEATISDGQILIQSGYKDIQINESNSTSALGRSSSSIGLEFNNDFGGFVSSATEVISTTYENKDISVSNWADIDTSLASLNITSGTLSVYRDGQKALINITSDDTFATLQSKIQSKLNDVELSFDNGRLVLKSNAGYEVATGSSTDTSNFSSITGVVSQGKSVKSAKELYKVNSSVGLTSDSLFRQGNITEGTFGVGEATFTIDSTTTLNDIVAMINNSDEAGAYAYWDSVDGRLYIESKLSGSMYVNIEKGTSNFTDVMGLTVTDRDTNSTIMNVDSQVVGQNAEFTINGTTYTSNSNTINSDISRIDGVTLYLKNVSPVDDEFGVDEEQTLTITKDDETLANAIEEVIDTYNDLMVNVDEAISAGGDLQDQTSLKMIRNQLRSLMTSSLQGVMGSYRNLDAIGISVDKAVGSNISTTNLTNLNFDREKFANAYKADPYSVKSLLIGDNTNKGVLIQIENLVESTLAGVTGYFDTQNASYMKQIQQFNDRITKENRATARYQEMLENKFSSLDLLVSQMQHQYSSFLSTQ